MAALQAEAARRGAALAAARWRACAAAALLAAERAAMATRAGRLERRLHTLAAQREALAAEGRAAQEGFRLAVDFARREVRSLSSSAAAAAAGW